MLTLIRLRFLRVVYSGGQLGLYLISFCQIFSGVNTSHRGWGIFWLRGCQLLEEAFLSVEFTKPSETKFLPGFYHHTPGRGASLIPSRQHLLENLFPIKQNEGRTISCMSKLWLDFHYADFNFWTNHSLLQILNKTYLEERKYSCSLILIWVMLSSSSSDHCVSYSCFYLLN